MTDDLAPGFYVAENGVRRYWDGEQWLSPEKGKDPVKRKQSLRWLGVGALVVGLSVGGYLTYQEIQYQRKVGILAELHSERSAELRGLTQSVVDTCSESAAGFDANSESLVIQTIGQENFAGATLGELECALRELQVPESVWSRVGATSSLQGLVSGSWKAAGGDADVTAEWNYHPNPGMTMTLELSSSYFAEFQAPERY